MVDGDLAPGGAGVTRNNFPLFATPSRLYGAARERALSCPAHDHIQSELTSFLKSRPWYSAPDSAQIVPFVEAEYPFTNSGRVIAFADVLEMVNLLGITFVNIYEIKPKIDSVFAVLRQVKALLHLAKVCIKADYYLCFIVGSASDPKLPDMRTQWRHTWGWGGEFDVSHPHD